jgi:meiotically up-regulated gene 157 (Mug157) protein
MFLTTPFSGIPILALKHLHLVEPLIRLTIAGAGNPLNANTSLVRSAFRPSDDSTILQFLVPANAFMAVELGHLSEILRDVKHHTSVSADTISFLAEEARSMSIAITAGLKTHAIFDHPLFDRVYAYEVDGYGGRIFMDDANLPSLLSLPLLGFVDRNDPVYQNTRKMVLSRLGNPYFLEGEQFKGIGGPHIGTGNAWPMSVLVQIMTSDNDAEIMELLEMLTTSTARLGLMHETGMFLMDELMKSM